MLISIQIHYVKNIENILGNFEKKNEKIADEEIDKVF